MIIDLHKLQYFTKCISIPHSSHTIFRIFSARDRPAGRDRSRLASARRGSFTLLAVGSSVALRNPYITPHNAYPHAHLQRVIPTETQPESLTPGWNAIGNVEHDALLSSCCSHARSSPPSMSIMVKYPHGDAPMERYAGPTRRACCLMRYAMRVGHPLSSARGAARVSGGVLA